MVAGTEGIRTFWGIFSSYSKQPRRNSKLTANEFDIESRQNTSVLLVSSASPKGINDKIYAIVDSQDNNYFKIIVSVIRTRL